MAKAPTFDIRPYSGGTGKVNPYTDHVAALINARDQFDADEAPSIFITVPSVYQTAKGEEKDNTARTKRYFQDAAKAAGYSSRVIDEEDSGDDDAPTTTIGFVLTDRVLRPRKAAADPADEAEAA